MPAIVYVIPGLFGSELNAPGDAGYGQPCWAGWVRTTLGHLYQLELAPDGVTPGGPYGQPCTPGPPLASYYSGLIGAVRRVQDVAGGLTIPWGYDWRLDPRTTAQALADAILATPVGAGGVGIVAHSLGGLVSRLAYARLLAVGQQGLIASIVTLASPHLGSYSWPITLGDGDLTIQSAALAQAAASGAGLDLSPGYLPPAYSFESIARVCATWPSMYALLPPLQGDWETTDPLREALYQSANWWPAYGISQAHLDTARTAVHPLLAGSTTRPGGGVLTAVVAYGGRQPYTLAYPTRLGRPNALGVPVDGDGTVSVLSAEAVGDRRYYFPGSHQSIVSDSRVYALLTEMLVPGTGSITATTPSTPGGPWQPLGLPPFHVLPPHDC